LFAVDRENSLGNDDFVATVLRRKAMKSMSGGSGSTRPAKALTHLAIQALKAEEKPYRVPDTRCPGLAVRVATNGAMTWDFSYRVKRGRVRRVSLGMMKLIGLEEARIRANEIRKAARDGRDLVQEVARKQIEEQRRVSVSELIEVYAKRRLRGRLRTAHEIELRLKRSLKKLLKYAAADIKRRDIREILDAVADRGYLREAEQQRQVLGTMMRWAQAQDYINVNPVDGLNSYSSGSIRDRTLSSEEVASLWAWLVPSNLPQHHCDILKLQLLLGSRCGEICGMKASEVDLESSIWTLPAERSKNGKPRTLPLMGMVREIVVSRVDETQDGRLFASEFGNTLRSVNVGNLLVKRRSDMPIDHFTSHDLRRTAATGMVDLGIPLDTVAAILGHQSGGSGQTRTLVRHYVKTERMAEKERALAAWEGRLRVILGLALDNVIEFNRFGTSDSHSDDVPTNGQSLKSGT
jgi:integrase